jgi:hypothetical protein
MSICNARACVKLNFGGFGCTQSDGKWYPPYCIVRGEWDYTNRATCQCCAGEWEDCRNITEKCVSTRDRLETKPQQWIWISISFSPLPVSISFPATEGLAVADRWTASCSTKRLWCFPDAETRYSNRVKSANSLLSNRGLRHFLVLLDPHNKVRFSISWVTVVIFQNVQLLQFIVTRWRKIGGSTFASILLLYSKNVGNKSSLTKFVTWRCVLLVHLFKAQYKGILVSWICNQEFWLLWCASCCVVALTDH